MTDQFNDEITMDLPDSGLRIDAWTQYSFNSNFLTPTDGWSFTVAHESLPTELVNALIPGKRVTLSIGGHIQGDGYIDSIRATAERGDGTQLIINGRDRLSPAVSSNMDPRTKFADGQTLFDMLKQIFSPFGWSDDSQYLIDDSTNLGVLTGQTRGIKASKKGKPLKSIVLHQTKPYPNEGTFSFAARVCQRHGLWIWLSAEGNALIIGQPLYDQEPLWHLSRKTADGGANNIEGGGVYKSLENQPTIIVAQGRGGGGEFNRSNLTVLIENPICTANHAAIFASYPDARELTFGYPLPLIAHTLAVPMFLTDDESHTPEQLEAFARREMALRVRQAFTAQYTVEGHGQHNEAGELIPWAVNGIVSVDDDRANTTSNMWIMSRTFTKSRTTGTRTNLDLILPGALTF